MGSLEVYCSLFEDVVDNVYSVVFCDLCFVFFIVVELDQLDLQIFVLSKFVLMQFVDEVDLFN